MTEPRTPSQTVGPYLALGLPWADGPDVVAEGAAGAIWLRGRLLDGHGAPIPDGLVETWQADPNGHFAHPEDDGGGSTTFRGFGRSSSGPDGSWAIRTCKPGPVDWIDGRPQAPHIDVTVFARGLLKQLVTRVYFADEATANAADPVLQGVEADRRGTLLATPTADGYAFDIRLQGPAETVFFDV